MNKKQDDTKKKENKKDSKKENKKDNKKDSKKVRTIKVSEGEAFILENIQSIGKAVNHLLEQVDYIEDKLSTIEESVDAILDALPNEECDCGGNHG